MKKGIIIAFATAALVFAGAAGAANLDPVLAWVGGMNTNPTTVTPQALAGGGKALSLNERKKVYTDNDVWYQWTEPSDKDYDWMIFSFKNPAEAVSSATLNWQVAIDHDSNSVHLLYWHETNQSWVWLDSNAGGRNPATKHTNVKTAFDLPGAIVIFMFVGYTPAAADNWIKCDVADVDRD